MKLTISNSVIQELLNEFHDRTYFHQVMTV